MAKVTEFPRLEIHPSIAELRDWHAEALRKWDADKRKALKRGIWSGLILTAFWVAFMLVVGEVVKVAIP